SEDNEEYSFIRYISEVETDDNEVVEQVIEAYVHNERIVLINEADEYRTERLESESLELEKEDIDSEDTSEQLDEKLDIDSVEDQAESKDLEERVEKEVEENNEITAAQVLTVEQSEPLIGLALKQPVAVYVATNRNSEVLKSYNNGHLLKFRPYSANWYKATVYQNGKPHTGYIHTSDVGEAKNASTVTGVALKQRTSVYSDTTKSSKVLKSYQQGHILKYKAYDKDWFIATVFINGKAHT